MTQKEALDILKTGRNVFITGPAGSGKTHVVNEYIKYLKHHNVSVGITASTGIAATHLGGITLHSWSGMGIKDRLDISDLTKLTEKKKTVDRIRKSSTLIIDEVSMLHHFRLDTLNDILRYIRKNQEPFGGMQIVLCGDFFQLPPVSRYGDPDTHFIYRSEAWRDGRFTVCYLSENYRQKEDRLLHILNEIRSGEVSDRVRTVLKERYRDGSGRSVSSRLVQTETQDPDLLSTISVRLYTHNSDVDTINERELSKVSGIEISHEMRSKGKKPLVDVLKRSCLAPDILKIKKGARVMCVKNNFDEGYVNGTLGTVLSCGPDSDPIILTVPSSEYPNGRKITIASATWTIEEDGRVLAQIEQYPLRLAWAITVHKSQGMSLDSVEVDLSKSFESGMGYVALSRARTLEGLSILGINEHALRVHPEVLEYDSHLKRLSDEAVAVLACLDRTEIEHAHMEFLAKVAPLYRLDKRAGRSSRKSVSDMRDRHLSTYEKTEELIRDKKTLKEISNIRDISIETVISHLEKIISRKKLDLDISYLKYEISPQYFIKIQKALEEVYKTQKDGKPPLLSSVKNRVSPNISFNDIRLARVLLGYMDECVDSK